MLNCWQNTQDVLNFIWFLILPACNFAGAFSYENSALGKREGNK